jgi:hypothetical protein
LFDNKELEKEVNTFLRDLKKSNYKIMSVLVESYKEHDSVFITLTNSYPDIERIKAYATYKGVYFCFGGDYPLNGYYRVIDPDPVPPKLVKQYEDFNEKDAVNYEPFTRMITFFKGKIEKDK